MTPEEKEQFYREFKERMFLEFQELMYLNMPDIIGNLINQHMRDYKTRETLFSKRPEFRKRPDLVASVLKRVEGENTLLGDDKIIEKALPEIDKLLKDVKLLDMKTVPKRPDLHTHGEL